TPATTATCASWAPWPHTCTPDPRVLWNTGWVTHVVLADQDARAGGPGHSALTLDEEAAPRPRPVDVDPHDPRSRRALVRPDHAERVHPDRDLRGDGAHHRRQGRDGDDHPGPGRP